MLQRTFTALVISVLVLAFPSAAAAQTSLTLPPEIVGSPGQYPSATGTLTLGTPGNYSFKYKKLGTLTVNLQIGSVAGSVPNIAADTPFWFTGMEAQDGMNLSALITAAEGPPSTSRVFIDPDPALPGQYRVAVGVWYVCCEN